MEEEVKEYVCLVCKENGEDKKFTTWQGLSRHLSYMDNQKNHGTSKDYYDRFLKKEGEGICQNPNCPNGNPETSFQSITKGYSVGCCNSCSQSVPSVRKKTENTCFEKYRCKAPQQNKEVQQKSKNTLMERYDTDNPMKVEEIKNRSVETRRPRQQEIQKVREKVNLQRFGVINVMKDPFIANKLSDEFINRSKDNIIRKLDLLGFETILYTKCSSKCILKCKKCGNEIIIKPAEVLYNNRIFICDICFPDKYGYMQNELFDFIYLLNNNIIKNDRTILEGKEIDILVTDINLGIEFDGLYWHSETRGIPRNYHRNKTILAESKGIELIHIFEDEWLFKPDIIKSMIKYRLSLVEESIYGRNTIIEFIGYEDAINFLNINHIQGAIPSKINIGLISPSGELVSLLSMCPSRFNHYYEWEILRFCNKLNSNVVGGFSKLLKFFISRFKPKSIITYADARFGHGKVYTKNGFNRIGHSKPNYFYINNMKRESRQKYQKHKLEKLLKTFNPNLTEWENMKINGFDRIWDCGNYVFGWE